jgi:hypothetical protein
LLVPPTVVLLEFKTVEELRLMPQTAEEHIQAKEEEDEDEGSGDKMSDSSSDSSSDDDGNIVKTTTDSRNVQNESTHEVSAPLLKTALTGRKDCNVYEHEILGWLV